MDSTRESRSAEKAERKAARELVAAYHETELRRLLEHVRAGFVRLDAGEIDAFQLDEIIHRYKRAAVRLWSFCGSSGGSWQQAANALRSMGERGEQAPDWWAESAPGSRR